MFAIEEAIISAIRERSYVPPLLTSLGIHLHRNYDSKYLNDILHACGLGCSDKENMKFETAALLAGDIDVKKGAFMQMSFDNADFNVRTLDGKNTFHAMGGIICATPYNSMSVQDSLPRNYLLPEGFKFSTTPIESYVKPSNFNFKSKMIVKLEVNEPSCLRKFQMIDTLYISSLFFEKRIASWSGFMAQNYNIKKDGFLVTKVLPVPFINLDSGNLDTIHTALRYKSIQLLQPRFFYLLVPYRFAIKQAASLLLTNLFTSKLQNSSIVPVQRIQFQKYSLDLGDFIC